MLEKLRIAIIGAGPGGLFLFSKLIEKAPPHSRIDIYEKSDVTGAGMPYSKAGALPEHITNVSANEIPDLLASLVAWVKSRDRGYLQRFGVDPDHFNEYHTLPRLLFGDFLSNQFRSLEQKAKEAGIEVCIYRNRLVSDIKDDALQQQVTVFAGDLKLTYNHVIICTGHTWPKVKERTIPGFFDSPYPPAKLAFHADHAIAIKGASLTAIDAIRTLSRHNGVYTKKDGKMCYQRNPDTPNFELVMHSLDGLLPAVRFHLEDSTLGKDAVLSNETIQAVRDANDGFVPLDYIFEKNFKELLRDKQPGFYKKIREMQMEAFVEMMMDVRERTDAFDLMQKEYEAAEKSIAAHQSIYWKEMLAVLSYSMNYPAKYFSAEDMLRLKKTLMPLISLVIAFVPQSSTEEMMALHEAGVLSLVSVGIDSNVDVDESGAIIYKYRNEQGEQVEQQYQTYIDCTGQSHLPFEKFPFNSLLADGTISPARLRFRDNDKAVSMIKDGIPGISKDGAGNYYLSVAGIAINDYFQVLDKYNGFNERVYAMAVPLIGGYNPDYSGLDFCDRASKVIAERLFS